MRLSKQRILLIMILVLLALVVVAVRPMLANEINNLHELYVPFVSVGYAEQWAPWITPEPPVIGGGR